MITIYVCCFAITTYNSFFSLHAHTHRPRNKHIEKEEFRSNERSQENERKNIEMDSPNYMGRRLSRKIHRGLDGGTIRHSQGKDTSSLSHMRGIKAKVKKNTVGRYDNRFRSVYRKIAK